MDGLSGVIQYVTSPLTLLAFLALVLLAMYRRSVRDAKGLEYVYQLFRDKLTRAQFYELASKIVNRTFWALLIIFSLSLGTFVIVELGSKGGIRIDRSVGDTISTGERSVVVTGGGDANVGNDALRGDVIVSQGGGNILMGDDETVIVSGRTAGRARMANPLARLGEKDRLSDAYRIELAPAGRGSDSLRALHGLRNVCDVDGRLCSALSDECEGFEELCPAHARWCDGATTLGQQFMREILNLDEDPETFCMDYGAVCADGAQRCRNLALPVLAPGVFGFQAPWVIRMIDLERTDTWSASPLGTAEQEVHYRPGKVLALVGFVTEEQAALLADSDRKKAVELRLYALPHSDATRAVSIPLRRITHFVLGVGEASEAPGIQSNDIVVK